MKKFLIAGLAVAAIIVLNQSTQRKTITNRVGDHLGLNGVS